jgi:CheY-like chemotaxis protein
VDDEQDIRNAAKLVLESKGFQVICASNGDDALHKANIEKPDLVILDVVMPGKSGLEVCKTLKNQKETKYIPVIMFTVLGRDSDKELTKVAGADAHFLKPFSPDNLRAIVKQKIEQAKSDKLSKQLGIDHIDLATKNILFEFDPSTSYDRLIRDCIIEFIFHEAKPIVITKKGGVIQSSLKDEKEVRFEEINPSLMISPILKENSNKSIIIIYDSITDLILSSDIQTTYKSIQNMLTHLTEKKVTAVFLFNPSAHDSREVYSIRGLFSDHIISKQNGQIEVKITPKKIANTEQILHDVIME